MKIFRILCVCLTLTSFSSAEAQFFKKLKKRVEKAAEDTALRKADNKTRKETGNAIDKTIDGKSKKKSKKSKSKNGQKSKGKIEASSNQQNTNVQFKAYSKFDFIPGNAIIGYDNFENSAIGDLPQGWNSSNSLEVVTLSNNDEKWIKLGSGKTALAPDFFSNLPENFTLEFDLIYDFDMSKWAHHRVFNISLSDSKSSNYQMDKERPGKNGLNVQVDGGIGKAGEMELSTYNTNRDLDVRLKKTTVYLDKNKYRGEVIRISMTRMGKRLKVYLNESKIYDLPQAFHNPETIKSLRFFSDLTEEGESYYLSNIRYAKGEPNTHELERSGKWVTYGITFSSNSAALNPSSYPVLKKVASFLETNPETHLSIIGHTDSDGDNNSNQYLSEERAQAVANALENQFNIEASRLTTIGKGESEPIVKESSPTDKAKNRRVEFIKF